MEIKLTKQMADEIMKAEGIVRGWDLKLMVDFIIKEAGMDGWEKVKKKLEKIGYPLKEDTIKRVRFSPLGLRVLIILSTVECLKWKEEKIREWGEYIPKKLMIIKFFSHLFRIKKDFFFKDLPRISARYLKGIEMIPIEGNVEKKYCILKIRKIKAPPIAEKIGLIFYEGFFKSWAQMILGTKELECKSEIESDYYKFKIKWQ